MDDFSFKEVLISKCLFISSALSILVSIILITDNKSPLIAFLLAFLGIVLHYIEGYFILSTTVKKAVKDAIGEYKKEKGL